MEANKNFSQAKKILFALVLGCIAGLVFNNLPDNYFLKDFVLEKIINLAGQMFVNLIKSMIVPLVFVSIALGVASIGNLEKLGSVGSKIVCFYLGTTAFAASIALFFAKLINPASKFYINNIYTQQVVEMHKKSMAQIILDIIPVNPIESLAKGDMLQIIFFAILIGIGITLIDQDKSAPIKKIFESLNEINLKLVNLIMKLAPLGVFALITYTFASFGRDIIFSLSRFLLLTYFVLIFQALITYSIMFKIFTRLDIKKFWKKFLPVAGIAFSSSSSNASLPVAIEAASNMGVPREISSFSLSLGSTINMNGTAIMQGITVVFLASIYQVDLSLIDIIKVVLTATLAAVGTAGVPGAGVLMLSMVLKLVSIPVEGIGLVLGIDRIIDAGRTVVNVMGDSVCTVIVAKLENDLDYEKFNS